MLIRMQVGREATNQRPNNYRPTTRFLARDSVVLRFRPSVRHTQVDQSKTAEVRTMQLSSQSSPMTLVSSWLTSPRTSKGNIWERGAECERGRKMDIFSQ